jgi:cytochrome b
MSISKTLVWDLPTRLFHIALILSVTGLFVTGEIGGDDLMQFHFFFGYTLLSLLLFRVSWGFVGGRWSRFSNFIPSPQVVLNYFKSIRKGHTERFISHNPLGALSVITMLCLLTIQVLSGLMSDDEISVQGPWVELVRTSWVEFATFYHTEIGKALIICLIALHIASVLFHTYIKGDDLINPMRNGYKSLSVTVDPSVDTPQRRLLALLIFGVCSLIVFFITHPHLKLFSLA